MIRAPFFTKYPSLFWKNAPRPPWEAWFWKRHKSKIMKHMPLGPSSWANMHPFCTIYCTPKFAKSIGKMCIFCLWPLLGSYIQHRLFYCMHLRWQFHIFALFLASFCEKMLAALGGKHDFESGTKAKSWNICLWAPPVTPICTLFAPFIAHRILQNPLEQFVFFVYGPFWEAILSIVCFIGCI